MRNEVNKKIVLGHKNSNNVHCTLFNEFETV